MHPLFGHSSQHREEGRERVATRTLVSEHIDTHADVSQAGRAGRAGRKGDVGQCHIGLVAPNPMLLRRRDRRRLRSGKTNGVVPGQIERRGEGCGVGRILRLSATRQHHAVVDRESTEGQEAEKCNRNRYKNRPVWPENSPLVIHEAFLAGVPVVASRIGGIPEVVSDQVNGLLFRPGDVEDLRGAVTRLVSEPGLLSSLRDGIPSVRTIEDDVDECRRLYAAQIAQTSGDTTERVAAVVLNYNTPDETVLSVRSLLASRRAIDDVIVVDNHPSNGCRQALGPLLDLGHMTYLKPGRNLGFSGGMNVGIRHALVRGAAHVMLVNSDVFVPPDCLEQLERALADRPNVGIVGPVVRIRSHPDHVASLGMSYVPWSGRMRHQGFGTTLDAPTAEGPAPDRPIDAVSGCLMLVTREVFEKVGLLDEDYFFSFEDLDLCLRARHSGFASVLVGAASVYHEGARSVGPDSLDRLYYAARNHQLLAHRTAPGTNRLQAVGRGLSILGLNVAYGIKFRGGSLASRLAAVAQGTGDFLRGRFGPR